MWGDTQAVAAELFPVLFCAPGRPKAETNGPWEIRTDSLPESPNLVIFPPLPAVRTHFALTAVAAVQISVHEASVAAPELSTVMVHLPSGEVLVQGRGTVTILESREVPNISLSPLIGIS